MLKWVKIMTAIKSRLMRRRRLQYWNKGTKNSISPGNLRDRISQNVCKNDEESEFGKFLQVLTNFCAFWKKATSKLKLSGKPTEFAKNMWNHQKLKNVLKFLTWFFEAGFEAISKRLKTCLLKFWGLSCALHEVRFESEIAEQELEEVVQVRCFCACGDLFKV